MEYIQRFFTPPKQSYFLFGPRGTGKSTLMDLLYPDAIKIDLLKPDIFRKYLNWPEQLSELVYSSNQAKTIIIDEIQKAPTLLSVVHQLIEENKQLRFVLTGSSARKLKRSGADLLAGRALKKELHPFMASELGDLFSLHTALIEGMLPIVFNREEASDVLHAYISLYLKEEIQAEGLVRNIENFSRFLEVASFSHASQLNITNISRECAVKRKTVENYIDILKELLLAFCLPVFSRRAQRELSSHPKFYLFDTGVFRMLRPTGYLDVAEEINGAALEGLVAQHLIAWRDYTEEGHEVYFWRTRSGVEVDFIVYGSKGLWAIEVKNAKCIQSADTKSLEAFLEDYPEATAILLYRGAETLKKKNVLCVPCEAFLRQLTPNQGLMGE